jgi:murein DD-endopeptidase MepM/ murein hydrolase activator NlpD
MKARGNAEIRHFAAGATLLAICAIATGAPAAAGSTWPGSTYYTVVAHPGDTLAKLAARYGVSASAIVKLNGLRAPVAVTAGEVLRIPAVSAVTRDVVLKEALDRNAPNYAPPPKTFEASRYVGVHEEEPDRGASPHIGSGDTPWRFARPVRGMVISPFGPATNGERNDGINIATRLGAPILAAASGRVTYAGDGLKSYGNLILIAHPGGYVTAYAHAESIAVASGDHVERGQVIGAAGETGGVDRPQLHFEIRARLKPVDPEKLLASLP